MTHTSKEAAIRTELKKLDAVHEAFEYCKGLAGLKVPKNDGCFWGSLELGSQLSSGDQLARS